MNGVDLANRTHKEVVKLMKTAPDPVNLVVRARSEGNKSGRKTSLIQSHPHHSQVCGFLSSVNLNCFLCVVLETVSTPSLLVHSTTLGPLRRMKVS